MPLAFRSGSRDRPGPSLLPRHLHASTDSEQSRAAPQFTRSAAPKRALQDRNLRSREGGNMFRSAWLVQSLVLAGLLQAAQPTSAQKAAGGEIDQPTRSSLMLLYVWDSTIPGDTLATRQLLHFARNQGFDTLALEASPVGYGESGALERYRRFTQLAHAAGLRVLALSGFPWFTVSAQSGLPD